MAHVPAGGLAHLVGRVLLLGVEQLALGGVAQAHAVTGLLRQVLRLTVLDRLVLLLVGQRLRGVLRHIETLVLGQRSQAAGTLRGLLARGGGSGLLAHLRFLSLAPNAADFTGPYHRRHGGMPTGRIAVGPKSPMVRSNSSARSTACRVASGR